MGQKFAVYDDARTITAFYDDALCDPPDGSQFIAISDGQHAALLDASSKGQRIFVDENDEPQSEAPQTEEAPTGNIDRRR